MGRFFQLALLVDYGLITFIPLYAFPVAAAGTRVDSVMQASII